jgi:hypothetical protein
MHGIAEILGLGVAAFIVVVVMVIVGGTIMLARDEDAGRNPFE